MISENSKQILLLEILNLCSASQKASQNAISELHQNVPLFSAILLHSKSTEVNILLSTQKHHGINSPGTLHFMIKYV